MRVQNWSTSIRSSYVSNCGGNRRESSQELTVAHLYDAGISPYEIEESLSVPAETGYNWIEVVAKCGHRSLGDASSPDAHLGCPVNSGRN